MSGVRVGARWNAAVTFYFVSELLMLAISLSRKSIFTSSPLSCHAQHSILSKSVYKPAMARRPDQTPSLATGHRRQSVGCGHRRQSVGCGHRRQSSSIRSEALVGGSRATDWRQGKGRTSSCHTLTLKQDAAGNIAQNISHSHTTSAAVP